MVITSATRNRVAVRHVGSNPTRSATEHLIMVLFFFAKFPSKSRYICPTIDLIHFACETILPIANKCLYRLMSLGCFQLNLDILLCLIYNITKVNH